jgi:hypothetical protein
MKQVRRLHLERDEDVSGVSGTGTVAYGVEFPDDTIVLRWDTAVTSTVFYNSFKDLQTIVSHGGRTRIVFDDPVDMREASPTTCKWCNKEIVFEQWPGEPNYWAEKMTYRYECRGRTGGHEPV